MQKKHAVSKTDSTPTACNEEPLPAIEQQQQSTHEKAQGHTRRQVYEVVCIGSLKSGTGKYSNTDSRASINEDANTRRMQPVAFGVEIDTSRGQVDGHLNG